VARRRDDDPDDEYDDEQEDQEGQDDDDDDEDDGDEVVILRGRRADRFLEQYGAHNGRDNDAGRRRADPPPRKRAGRPAGTAARRGGRAEPGKAASESDRRPRAGGYFGDR